MINIDLTQCFKCKMKCFKTLYSPTALENIEGMILFSVSKGTEKLAILLITVYTHETLWNTNVKKLSKIYTCIRISQRPACRATCTTHVRIYRHTYMYTHKYTHTYRDQ